MQIFSHVAVYFIFWWLTLFAVLPFGLRTQAEADDVVPGTTESAPARFRGKRVFVWTTVVSAVVYLLWYVLSARLGYNIDSIPEFIPRFD